MKADASPAWKSLAVLIRLPNLVFIFLTQVLSWHFLVKPALHLPEAVMVLGEGRYLLLALSTTLIACAGYIINDYFDLGMDIVNKPERVTIERVFHRRAILTAHSLLNVTAILLMMYVTVRYSQLRLVIIQLLATLWLLWYSLRLKRTLLYGNLSIACLAAMSIATVGWFEPAFPLLDLHQPVVVYYWCYVCFAFMITFCREIIKDMEDIKGDEQHGCRTMPLVWGLQRAGQMAIAAWILLEAGIIFLIWLHHTQGLWMGYMFSAVFLPALWLPFAIHRATQALAFHRISQVLKWVTFAGILSMTLLYV